jgi:hypothetical protein
MINIEESARWCFLLRNFSSPILLYSDGISGFRLLGIGRSLGLGLLGEPGCETYNPRTFHHIKRVLHRFNVIHSYHRLNRSQESNSAMAKEVQLCPVSRHVLDFPP